MGEGQPLTPVADTGYTYPMSKGPYPFRPSPDFSTLIQEGEAPSTSAGVAATLLALALTPPWRKGDTSRGSGPQTSVSLNGSARSILLPMLRAHQASSLTNLCNMAAEHAPCRELALSILRMSPAHREKLLLDTLRTLGLPSYSAAYIVKAREVHMRALITKVAGAFSPASVAVLQRELDDLRSPLSGM